MNLSRTIVAGVAGTTAMTLYSYVLSELKNKNFKEPRLLATLLYRLLPLKKDSSGVTGWLLHYSVGILFALIYNAILRKRRIQNPAAQGAMIGAVSGIAAVLIWETSFRLHPAPPAVDYKRYYGQLVIAHIIFGTVAILVLAGKIRKTKNLTVQPVTAIEP